MDWRFGVHAHPVAAMEGAGTAHENTLPATLERPTESPGRPAAVSAPARVRPSAVPRRPEPPVFASETHRRARVMRVVGWVLAVLTALWLTALVLGAFGLKPLPGIPVPQLSGTDGGAPRTQTAPSESSTPARPAARAAGSSAASGREASDSRSSARRGESSRGDGSSSGRSSERGAGSSRSSTPRSTDQPSSPAPTTPAAPPATTTPTSPGSSATAPGAANRPDRSSTEAPGSSSTAPGHTDVKPGKGTGRSTTP